MESQELPSVSFSHGCEPLDEGKTVSEESSTCPQLATSQAESPQPSSRSLGRLWESPSYRSDGALRRSLGGRQWAGPDVSSVPLGDRTTANSGPERRPPFYLIATFPEEADALLIIPGSASFSPHGETPRFTETPSPLQNNHHGHSPRVPPSALPCPLMPLTTEISSRETGISVEESRRNSDDYEDEAVSSRHPFKEQESISEGHQKRGLFFVDAAMQHVYAMHRERRIPRDTRVRAFKVVWNTNPRLFFGSSGWRNVFGIGKVNHPRGAVR